MCSIFWVNCLFYILHRSFSDQNVQGKRCSKGWIHRVSWFLPGVALVGFVVDYLPSLHPSVVWLPPSVPGSPLVPDHYTAALPTPSAHLDHLNSNLVQHKSPVLPHLLCQFVLELLWQFCKSLWRNFNLFLPSGLFSYKLLDQGLCAAVSSNLPFCLFSAASRAFGYLPASVLFLFSLPLPISPLCYSNKHYFPRSAKCFLFSKRSLTLWWEKQANSCLQTLAGGCLEHTHIYCIYVYLSSFFFPHTRTTVKFKSELILIGCISSVPALGLRDKVPVVTRPWLKKYERIG